MSVSGTFTNNSATANGGAIYNDAQMTISKAEFTGNSAANGGAIYNTENGTVSLSDVIFNSDDVNDSNDIYNEGSISTSGENTFNSNIENNGSIDFGGTNSVGGNISGTGEIKNSGSVTLAGDNSGYTGSYGHSDSNAVTNVTGTFFDTDVTIEMGTLNWNTNTENTGAIIVTGESTALNIGSYNISGSLEIGDGSSIAPSVTTTIAEGSSLNITGGEVTLNSGDDWSGSVTMESGSLTLDGLTENGTLTAEGGSLDLTSGSLNIGDGSVIEKAAAVTITNNANLNISENGVVTLNDNDNIDGGTVSLVGGTLNYGMKNSDNATIEAETGYLNLLEGSTITIVEPSNIQDAVVVDIQEGATVKVEEGATFNLNGGNVDSTQDDKWNGLIVNEGGTVNADDISNSSTSGLQQTDGTTNIYNNSEIYLGHSSNSISGGTINITGNSLLSVEDSSIITGGDMTIDSTSQYTSGSSGFSLDNLTTSGLLSAQNSGIESYIMNTLQVNDSADFTIDIYARSANNCGTDQFIADVISADGATINISDWTLTGDIFGWDAPIDEHITLGSVFSYNTLEGNVEFESVSKEVFTPIGYYQLNNSGGLNGVYTLDLTRYNPQVFRGQVATTAQWMNQLSIDDMLFTHSMVLPSFKDEDEVVNNSIMANRYASISPLFAPYQYSRKNGGLWYKMYGNFENLEMNNNIGKVGNNAYGVLIGADFGLKELRNGWKFMPTAYIGYNGAHQTFANTSLYQNGGQVGVMGTWYKNNLIAGAMAYGGIYDNSMSVYNTTDNTFNYFAGAAFKTSYNIRFHRDWVLQPNLFAAYNFFGQQNWHTTFGQMGMMTGLLNGVNIAPGLNLIWEKETFSTYLTLQYMFNANGAVGGRAGNVSLPHVEMERGYIQYGIGFTKKFTDRFSGYLQAVLRNVGRTGAGFQLGFNYYIGK